MPLRTGPVAPMLTNHEANPAAPVPERTEPRVAAGVCAAIRARVSPATRLLQNEPLARRTTLRVGGPADLYVEPASEGELAEVLRCATERGCPVLVLGRGSNLLIRDGGVRGVVICLAHPAFSQVKVTGRQLRCGAGAKLKTVATTARHRELGGLEFMEGIPGSVGGALRMNAGAMGSWVFAVTRRVRLMSYGGQIAELTPTELRFEYRGCPALATQIALEALFEGTPEAPATIRQRLDAFSARRWESQPHQPSAGCIFKNPSTIPAGKLIDELGLKGARVGGAVVSEVHANFIINEGGATARDVLGLIDVIRQRAQSARGIDLHPEIMVVGEDETVAGGAAREASRASGGAGPAPNPEP